VVVLFLIQLQEEQVILPLQIRPKVIQVVMLHQETKTVTQVVVEVEQLLQEPMYLDQEVQVQVEYLQQVMEVQVHQMIF
jgi:Tfp pilus assembly protein PilN